MERVKDGKPIKCELVVLSYLCVTQEQMLAGSDKLRNQRSGVTFSHFPFSIRGEDIPVESLEEFSLPSILTKVQTTKIPG